MALLGPFCDASGIRGLSDLKQLPINNFKNGHLTELYIHVRSKNIPWNEVQNALDGCWDQVPRHVLPLAFKSAYRKKQQLSKNARDSEQLDEFLYGAANLTHLYSSKQSTKRKTPPCSADEPVSKKPSFDSLVEDVVCETSQKLVTDLAVLQRTVGEQQHEIICLRRENEVLRKQNVVLQEKVRKYCPKRVNQSLKRKSESADHWHDKSTKNEELARSAESSVEKVKELSSTCKKLKDAKRKQQLRFEKRQPKSTRKSLPVDYQCHAQALVSAGKHIQHLEGELLELETSQDSDTSQVIPVKEDGKTYTSAIREASYSLQSLGVAEAKVGSVIQTVIEKVAQKELAGPLPSTATQAKLSSEMTVVARQHVVDTLRGATNLTLKYDGTTKGGSHFTEVELATADKTLLAGVRRQCGGTAEDYVQTITKTLQDCTNMTDETDRDLLEDISNTMTDRCVTNQKVDGMLRQVKGGPINSFRCGAHPLDTFQSELKSALRDYEKEHPPPPCGLYTKHSESVTHCLVRKVADLFFNDQTGCKEMLSTHLRTKFQAPANKTVWIPRFVGNRWNIVVKTAGLLHLYHDALLEFFNSVHAPSNELQRAIHSVLKSHSTLVPLRALGLVLKYVTGPWQQVVEDNVQILELNHHFHHARQVLSMWSQNPGSVVDGSATTTIFEGTEVRRDEMFDSLTKSHENDQPTRQLFGQMCQKIIAVIDRQLADQLPGGQFYQPSEELLTQSQSCSATNISGERVFGKVDAVLKRAPNVSISKLESKMMFASNKAEEWLAEKSPVEKRQIINNARHLGGKVRADDKQQKSKFQERLVERLQFKRVQLSEREERRRNLTEKQIEDAIKCGVWSAETIDGQLQGKSVTRQKTDLRTQISLLSKVIGIRCDEKLAVTKASIQDLRKHFLLLLQQPSSPEQQERLHLLQNPSSLVGRTASHTWSVDGQPVLFEVKVVKHLPENDEFEIDSGEESPYFLTRSEVLTDILRADFVLH